MKSKLNVEMIVKALDEIVNNTEKKVASEIISDIEQAIMAHGTKYASKRLEEIKKKYGVTEDETKTN